MYYSGVRHFSNPIFLCEVENKHLEEINGDNCAELVGTFGAVLFKQTFDTDQINDWKHTLGYHLNNDLPPRDFSDFDTSLALYPDNEEILIIHNSSHREICLCVINSARAPKDLINWNTWNLYDDIWVTVSNKSFDKSLVKEIHLANNFDIKNKNKYNPVRINHYHHYKIFPRHPFWTECMFSPKKYMVEMKTYNQNILPDHGVMIEGISTRIFNEQYKKEIKLLPNQCLILDQIITQWKCVDCDQRDLTLIPLWYKTNLRKHFNYSL